MKHRTILISAFLFVMSLTAFKIISDRVYVQKNVRKEPIMTAIMKGTMKITSPAFKHNGKIPQKYTCEGENISPPLAFSDIPEGTKSLVLLMDDPDVPKSLKPDGMFDHWVVFNISPDTRIVAEGTPPPGVQGLNGVGKKGYIGPCPPDREHRYFFKLFAVSTLFTLGANVRKEDVEKALEKNTLEKAELIGRYEKKMK